MVRWKRVTGRDSIDYNLGVESVVVRIQEIGMGGFVIISCDHD